MPHKTDCWGGARGSGEASLLPWEEDCVGSAHQASLQQQIHLRSSALYQECVQVAGGSLLGRDILLPSSQFLEAPPLEPPCLPHMG